MRSALEWPGNAPATFSPAMLSKVEGEQALAAVEPGTGNPEERQRRSSGAWSRVASGTLDVLREVRGLHRQSAA